MDSFKTRETHRRNEKYSCESGNVFPESFRNVETTTAPSSAQNNSRNTEIIIAIDFLTLIKFNSNGQIIKENTEASGMLFFVFNVITVYYGKYILI